MAGKRKYTCNYRFFKNIDTEEKAYWLGFIYADGCVMEYTRKRKLKTMTSLQTRRYLQLSLSEVDVNHIKKFLKDIDSNHKICTYKNSKGKGNYSRVIIEDNDLFYDLHNKGVVPRKTEFLTFPNFLRKDLEIHFIRGYFDGDGCLSHHNSKHGNLSFEFNVTGTKEFLLELVKRLPINRDTKIRKRHDNDVNNYTFKYTGNQQSYRSMKLLYENANIYLDRKYDKYLLLKERINQIEQMRNKMKGRSYEKLYEL